MLHDPPAIALPDPSLVLLVGPAGAGKTTFVRRHFGTEEIVGSDELRESLTGDPADQSRNRLVFALLHRAVERRLASGGLAVVDATNLDRRARRDLLRLAEAAGVPAVAVILAIDLSSALARNAARPGRTVDPAVVEAQHRRLGRLLERDRIVDEGFDAVHVLRGAPAIDGARIGRLHAPAGDR